MSRRKSAPLALAAALRCALVALALVALAPGGFGAEPPPPPAVMGKADETNTQDMLRAYLQVQEQLHATQLSIERSRKEADAAAAAISKVFAERLQAIDQTLTVQRKEELQTIQGSHNAMLVVAGLFAVLGFLAMLFMAYFQWRTISRMAEISAALPVGRTLGPGLPLAAFGAGNSPGITVSSADRSSQKLLDALGQLEKRMRQLGRTSTPPLNEDAPSAKTTAPPPAPLNSAPPASTAADAARITVLLGKGQSLLNLDQAEGALACFDQALALDPNHAEVLVKKGTALERLQNLEEAIEYYDRAIAADASMTVAYLYKGGLFNRMERFSEALECYEKALRMQETGRG
jgi:tetratricopeptide (TPR) repeat protein